MITRHNYHNDNANSKKEYKIKKKKERASLVAQWLRICPPMQGTWVPALVREDPAAEQLSLCATTTEPTCHNY